MLDVQRVLGKRDEWNSVDRKRRDIREEKVGDQGKPMVTAAAQDTLNHGERLVIRWLNVRD